MTQVRHAMVPVVVMGPPVIGPVVAILMTVPLPGGADQVPSPLQNVLEVALVPPLRLVTGRFPVTSVESATGPNVGSPDPFPCRTVVVVPSVPSPTMAWSPPPTNIWLVVNAAADVVQVGHDIVPVVEIGPPLIGPVVEIRLTEPVPPGIFHVPSPAQKVVPDALVPELR